MYENKRRRIIPLKLVMISDTHTMHDQITVPDGDVVICAGDISYRGTEEEVVPFLQWFDALPHKHKILIAGNHDWGFETKPRVFQHLVEGTSITYLNDSGVVIDGQLFWGSPVQPEFCGWAFNRERTKEDAAHPHSQYNFIGEHWDLIPDNTDVLITHGPPAGLLDKCEHGERVGCDELMKAVARVRPRVHVFGHIHEARGLARVDKTIFVNASSVDARYKPYAESAIVLDI